MPKAAARKCAFGAAREVVAVKTPRADEGKNGVSNTPDHVAAA